MPTRFIVTYTPTGHPAYKVGEFPTEEGARDAAEKHGAPPRGANPRPALEWEPARQFGSLRAVTDKGVFVLAPA